MSKLPAVVAVSMIVTLAAAAPAAQGRRVLVAVERDAHSPAGGSLVGTLPDGSPMFVVPVRRGSARDLAHHMAHRRGVIAAQVDHPLHKAQQATGCVDKPDPALTAIPKAVNAYGIEGVASTKPIAILDTGVDPDVPELSGRVLGGYDALARVDTTGDIDGHGTEVASVAAAAPGGIQGVSPTSPILPIRIFNESGGSSSEIVVQGITEAVSRGAGVINISAAGPLSEATPAANSVMTVAIAQAFAAGVVTVAASGNEGKLQPDVPGAYPHVLTIGSGNAAGGRDTFSNSGPWLDLLAPGFEQTVSTPKQICTSGYAVVSGTSYAAPAVAGAVAILQHLKPGITTQQLFDLVRHAADDVGASDFDLDSGFGFLNVLNGVTGPTPPAVGNEIDDDILFAKLKPVVSLKLGRAKKIADSLSASEDTTDVFRIKLKKGEAISANVSTKVTGALFSISLLDRTSGGLDLTNDVTKHVLKNSGGLSNTAFFTKRVKRAGTYFVAVETPDTLQDEDTSDSTPIPDQAYTLKLKRQKPLKHKKTKKKSAKK
jgi:subtilisin family serine protease